MTILGCLYLAVGVIGFIYHLRDGGVWVELSEAVAIVTGTFLLLGRNWARWIALAWIAFHVVLSAFHSLSEFAMHALFCAIIAWLLFRPAAGRYFHQRA